VDCYELQPCPKHRGELRGHAGESHAPLEVQSSPKTILLAVDNSPETERAVAWALEYFPSPKFRFHAVHVYDWTVVGIGQIPVGAAYAYAAMRQQAEDSARVVLRKIVAQFEAAGRKADLLHNIGLRGSVQEVISAYITENECDVLVLGCRGMVGLKKWISSVSNSLIHYAPCSVALIKAQPENDRSPDAPRNIVMAVDGSAHSLKAYTWAKENVLQPNDMVSLVMAFKEHPDSAAGKAVLDHEREFTAGLCLEVTKITGNDCHLFLLPGDARQVIPEVVAKVGRVDLLVMGSRGRGPLASLVLGSVVNYCTGAVSCPLLVIK